MYGRLLVAAGTKTCGSYRSGYRRLGGVAASASMLGFDRLDGDLKGETDLPDFAYITSTLFTDYPQQIDTR